MSRLIVGDDGAGPRHYVDQKPVRCGSTLEVLLNGRWVPVRYEATFRDGKIEPMLITASATITPFPSWPPV